MEPEKIKEELDNLWNRYQEIISQENPPWEEINEARAILFLTGQIYCEKIAVEAIERRLHLLKAKLSLVEFLELIDKNSERLEELRKDELFDKLEKFYRIIKGYKNKYLQGKYYLEEEKFLKIYEKVNPDKEFKIGYRGSFK
jgi:hypothetical protein